MKSRVNPHVPLLSSLVDTACQAIDAIVPVIAITPTYMKARGVVVGYLDSCWLEQIGSQVSFLHFVYTFGTHRHRPSGIVTGTQRK